MTAPLLRISHLGVTYGGSAIAVQGVSLTVEEGAIVVLLGRNGAGKTTTLRAVSGFLPIDAARITDGEIRLRDQRIDGRPPHVVARAGVALIPERDKVFRGLTVAENLEMVPMRHPRERARLVGVIEDLFPALKARWRQAAGYLSGGEAQMLAIGRALLLQPQLLLADEVSLGIAPALVTRIMEALRRINAETGMGILMAEQNALAALSIAQHAYVLDGGSVVQAGTPQYLIEHRVLEGAYLGTDQSSTYAEGGGHGVGTGAV
jgi:branched-chain amino acid transport system ATP-binding protein